MALTLDDINAAVKAMRAKFDPSALTQAAGDQTLSNFQYNDTLNGLFKGLAGTNAATEQQAQLAKNGLNSQLQDYSRKYTQDQRNLRNDFADRGMFYSGGHVTKQAELGGQYVADTGAAQNKTADYLSGLKQQLLSAQTASQEQQRQAEMQKLQTDQAYALAQAQTQAYINSLNQVNNPQPAPTFATAAPAATTTPGDSVSNTHSQGWGQGALQRFQQGLTGGGGMDWLHQHQQQAAQQAAQLNSSAAQTMAAQPFYNQPSQGTLPLAQNTATGVAPRPMPQSPMSPPPNPGNLGAMPPSATPPSPSMGTNPLQENMMPPTQNSMQMPPQQFNNALMADRGSVSPQMSVQDPMMAQRAAMQNAAMQSQMSQQTMSPQGMQMDPNMQQALMRKLAMRQDNAMMSNG